MAAAEGVPVRGTPLLGLKLGACSCVILASDRQRLLGEELSVSRSPNDQADEEDWRYAPTEAEPVTSEERRTLVQRNSGDGVVAKLEKVQPSQERQKPEAQEAPMLGPVGCGGWQMEEHMTEEMRRVRREAVEQMEQQENARLPQRHLDFLTSATLVNYVNPAATHHLVNTLKRRIEMEDILTVKKDIYLNCSFRVVGWDGEGSSVVAQEWSTMRKGIAYALDQAEYVGWTSLDLNKPGANGFAAVVDFGGGFNPFHFLNPKPMMSLAGMIEGQWRRRLKAAYMVEMPPSFERFMNFFLRALKESTRSKFVFLRTVEELCDALRKAGCDEETIATCQTYMANRRQSRETQKWFPLIDHAFFKERLADLGWNQDLEYLTAKHHERLREVIQQFRVWKWGIPEAGAAPPLACSGDAGGAGGARRGGGGRLEQEAPAQPGDASRAEAARKSTRTRLQRLTRCLVCGACGK